MPDHYTSTHLNVATRKAFREQARRAGWLPAHPAGDGPSTGLFGTWTDPAHAVRLTAREPAERLFDDTLVAEIELTGEPEGRRPWTVSGQCTIEVLPALMQCAVRAPSPAPDPASVLEGDWWREGGPSYPAGRYFEYRWLQHDVPRQRGTIDELAWIIAGQDRPDIAAGWHLVYARGHVLVADLATPRHIVTGIVTALNSDIPADID